MGLWIGSQMVGDPKAVGKSAWYEYSNWEAEIPLQPGVDWAVSYVHHLIQQEHKIVGDYGRIILAGSFIANYGSINLLEECSKPYNSSLHIPVVTIYE